MKILDGIEYMNRSYMAHPNLDTLDIIPKNLIKLRLYGYL